MHPDVPAAPALRRAIGPEISVVLLTGDQPAHDALELALEQHPDAAPGDDEGPIQFETDEAFYALEATLAGYDAGTRTSVDVLLSQRQLFSAKRDYSVARYTYLTNSLVLKQVAGILIPEDVDAINEWLIDRPAEESDNGQP